MPYPPCVVLVVAYVMRRNGKLLTAGLRDGTTPDDVAAVVRRRCRRLRLGRVAEPAEVATVCIHLALDATAVTGIDVPVDVGYTAS